MRGPGDAQPTVNDTGYLVALLLVSLITSHSLLEINSMPSLSIQPWRVTEQDFPTQGSATAQLQFLLNYAVLAPSGHNTQPWRFTLQPETLELWADRSRALPHVDPHQRELLISCGAALLNIRLALHHFGYSGDIEILPVADQADLLARIRLGHRVAETAAEKPLFAAMPQRHTDRSPFADWDIPETVLKWLRDTAVEEGAWLQVVRGDMARSRLLALVDQADHLQMADPAMRKELAAWMHASHHPTHDGLPAYALGLPAQLDCLTWALSLLTRWFDLGDLIAHQDMQRWQRAAAIVVLGTDDDTPQAWLTAGQALEKVLLRAQSLGIAASFFNAPLQLSAVRSQLQQSLNRAGYPQVLLRLGYGASTPPTPRRSSQEVLF
jgi:Nitroreductase family